MTQNHKTKEEESWLEKAIDRRRFLKLGAGSLLGAITGLGTFRGLSYGQSNEVAVISHNDPGNLEKWIGAFEKTTGLNANIINMSSGPSLRRIRSEAEAGEVNLDVWWGAEAAHSAIAQKEGLLRRVKTSNTRAIPNKYKSDKNYWFGYSFWASSTAVNKNRRKRLGLDMPVSWLDLEDSQYKNEIAAPDPNQSGTGFLLVASWIQIFGWDRAWEFMENLNKNVLTYTGSGSTPARHAASGEVTIGLTWDEIVPRLIDEGYPLTWWVPEEGLAYSLDTVQAVKDGPHPYNAITTVDYALSEKAMIWYSMARTVVTKPNVPEDKLKTTDTVKEWVRDAHFIDYDAEKASKQSEKILEEWNSRFA